MSENFEEFLDNRVDELEEKIGDLEKLNDRYLNNNYEIDKIKNEFGSRVINKRNKSILFGIAGTIILDYLFIKYVGASGILFSKLQHIMFSIVGAIPVFVGFKNALYASRNVEKEMNINLKKLNQDYLTNNSSIKCNKEKIEKLNIKLKEASYLKQVSDIYESGNLENVIEEEKQKTLVLKK